MGRAGLQDTGRVGEKHAARKGGAGVLLSLIHIWYETYDKNKLLLENNKRPKNLDFVIEDNKTTETKVGVTLYEADVYKRQGIPPSNTRAS